MNYYPHLASHGVIGVLQASTPFTAIHPSLGKKSDPLTSHLPFPFSSNPYLVSLELGPNRLLNSSNHNCILVLFPEPPTNSFPLASHINLHVLRILSNECPRLGYKPGTESSSINLLQHVYASDLDARSNSSNLVHHQRPTFNLSLPVSDLPLLPFTFQNMRRMC